MKNVNKAFRKKDAMQLVTGKPVYMDDLAPADCLIVKLYRSPHANAMVERIDTSVAKKVPGIEAIFTWEDVDQNARRYTQAGQTYPEASPYDRLVIDRHVRFVGDVVAIVVGKDEKCVEKAMKLIKVEYQVLEPVLDFHTAKDNPILVHPEDNWESLSPVGADNKRNLCAHDACGDGDIDAVLAKCDVVIDRVYHTKACQQAMMETFRTCCWMDLYGRLNILSSTQIVFHTRRNVANALHIPKSMIRVIKPRIGGGFGAKQTAVSAIYPAFVTWKTKKPCKLIFTREESQTASSPRHEPEMLNIEMKDFLENGDTTDFSHTRMNIHFRELAGESPLLVKLIMQSIYKEDRREIRHLGCKRFGVQFLLKSVHSHNGLFYFHTETRNRSNVAFRTDFIRFKIVDKKVPKRTAIQERVIDPVRSYNEVLVTEGKSDVRTVYAVPQFTIPDDKLLVIELFEKDGGRHQTIRVENADLVAARQINELKIK